LVKNTVWTNQAVHNSTSAAKRQRNGPGRRDGGAFVGDGVKFADTRFRLGLRLAITMKLV
jgi:hypothetical protein